MHSHELLFGRYFDQRYFDLVFSRVRDPWDYEHGRIAQERGGIIVSLIGNGLYTHVLEIGCAEGWMTPKLGSVAKELVSVDISAVALLRAEERCKALTNIRFEQMDLVTAPLPSGEFDLIVCAGVLTYLPQNLQVDIAMKITSKLRSGGLLLIENTRDSSAGRIKGESVHALYRTIPGLEVVHDQAVRDYEILVLRKVAP